MSNIIYHPDISMEEKLIIMRESAKYDISDDEGLAGLSKVPKIFMSNNCIFDCAYCGCRSSRDCKRRYNTGPGELARIAVEAAQNNGRGVFITSAIYKSPDYTEEIIVETLRRIRKKYGYTGYIHAKIMPGADPGLIREAGYLADRISINIELPASKGYALIARQKNKNNILKPMSFISEKIKESKLEKSRYARKFAPSGQTTQMMVGTMNETDRVLISLAEALYGKYNLSRVYYSAFNPVQEYEYLPSSPTPKWRVHRLYQADRLIQLYGFKANELTGEVHPNLDRDLDPKASWALRNLHLYPVEVNTADYDLLIKIPGIGVASARKILQARKIRRLTHESLMKMRIFLKRAKFFITCNGKYTGGNILGHPVLRSLISDRPLQMSLFDMGHKK